MYATLYYKDINSIGQRDAVFILQSQSAALPRSKSQNLNQALTVLKSGSQCPTAPLTCCCDAISSDRRAVCSNCANYYRYSSDDLSLGSGTLIHSGHANEAEGNVRANLESDGTCVMPL